MAVLSSSELQVIRNQCAAIVAVNYTKTQINAAAQAVEDLITANATAISNAINTATSPVTLTVAQKKILVAVTLYVKYLRDK